MFLRGISVVGVTSVMMGVSAGIAPEPSQSVAVSPATSVIQVPYAWIGDLVGMRPRRTMNAQLNGIFCQKGGADVCSRVQYPRSDTTSSIAEGVSDLSAKMAAVTVADPVIGQGYSLGGTVAVNWLQQFGRGGDGLPSADDLMFVLTGKPNMNGSAMTPMDVDTIYRVLNIVREYDGVADLPDDRRNFLAMLNSVVGFFLVHNHYTRVNVFDLANTVYKVGNITYVFVPTKTLPLLAGWEPLRWIGLGNVLDAWNAALKKRIDPAYNRELPEGAVVTTVADEFPELVNRVPASVRAQMQLTQEPVVPSHDVVEHVGEPAGLVETESPEELSASLEPESSEVVSQQMELPAESESEPAVEGGDGPSLDTVASDQTEGNTFVTDTVSTADVSSDSSAATPVKEPKELSQSSTRSGQETSADNESGPSD